MASPAGRRQPVAFAMGGLGGFNAHGVGFLKAALEMAVEPSFISCTSGQIYWVWRYLLERYGEPDPLTGSAVDIHAELTAEINRSNVFPEPFEWLDAPWMALTGDPGIFRPAVPEYWTRLFSPYRADTPRAYWEGLGEAWLNRLYPAQQFVPERPDALITAIGMRFAREAQIGLMFNAFDPQRGEEVLYLNPRAQAQLKAKRPGKYLDGERHNDTRVRVLDPTDAEMVRAAVEGALWLYLYGFETPDGGERRLVDGAYHRQFIIRELAPVSELIFSVRPQSVEWKSRMPTHALQVENFTTQLWFNASYSGETARIHLINDLLADGHLQPGKPYQKVRLEPIEYESPIRFFEYFVERQAVYEDAYNHSRNTFRLLREDDVLEHSPAPPAL